MMSLLVYIRTWLHNLKSEEGQDLVEYALLLGLIAIVAVAAIVIAGDAVSQIWSVIASILQSVATVVI
jgi:pilus assembly protein Flp/PilA